MANWASTSYRIEGSKSDLKRVYGVIDDFMSERRKPIEEDASKEWEGNVIRALGGTEEQTEKACLRGFIQEYEMAGDTIRIEAEEAWGTTGFRYLLERIMPELTVYYIVEESGCEVYATNDYDGKYFHDRYYVYAYVNDNYRSEYFETEEQAMAYAAELIGMENITQEKLKSWNKDQDDDDFVFVYEFDIEA